MHIAQIDYGKVQGYLNSESIERAGTSTASGTTSQGIDYGTGNHVEVGNYAFDSVGKDNANIVTTVKSGSISSYSDESSAANGETNTASARYKCKGIGN